MRSKKRRRDEYEGLREREREIVLRGEGRSGSDGGDWARNDRREKASPFTSDSSHRHCWCQLGETLEPDVEDREKLAFAFEASDSVVCSGKGPYLTPDRKWDFTVYRLAKILVMKRRSFILFRLDPISVWAVKVIMIFFPSFFFSHPLISFIK